MPMKFHLCQYNKARAVAPLDDPRLADFVNSQQALYDASDRCPGFVWRLADQSDTTGSVRPFEDQQTLVGLTVWEDAPSLKAFVYGAEHADLLRRRHRWFEPHAGANYVLWWKPAGALPTIAEGEERLSQLRAEGPSPRAFDFKSLNPPPAQVIGTLGPNGTNSEKAAQEYMARAGARGELLLFDTFEEVAERLLEGAIDQAVVCTAYLKFSALYFERMPHLQMIEAFVADLHPMVIAGRPERDRRGRPTFTAQPAIYPLVRRYRPDGDYIPAASNASAAVDVAAGKADTCLTTDVAARAHGLEILIQLPPLQIPFVVLTRSHSQEALPDELGHFLAPSSRRH